MMFSRIPAPVFQLAGSICIIFATLPALYGGEVNKIFLALAVVFIGVAVIVMRRQRKTDSNSRAS
jgi:hypothetical protein